MTDRQIKYLNSCKHNVRILMLDVMRAISEGNIISITYLYDGNGACFYYLDDYAKDGKNKKLAIKMLDLIFRFVAMVMALVTLLLCINENIDTKVLVVLLSIGLVCSSMTILPKIEK